MNPVTNEVEKFCLSATYTCKDEKNPGQVRNCFVLKSLKEFSNDNSNSKNKQTLKHPRGFDLAPAPLRKTKSIQCDDAQQLVCWNTPNDIKTSCRKTSVGQIQSDQPKITRSLSSSASIADSSGTVHTSKFLPIFAFLLLHLIRGGV